MVASCSVHGCKSSLNDKIKFRRFPPVTSPMFRQWLAATGDPTLHELDPNYIRNNKRICNLHFEKKFMLLPTFQHDLVPPVTENLNVQSLQGANQVHLDHPYATNQPICKSQSSETCQKTEPADATNKEKKYTHMIKIQNKNGKILKGYIHIDNTGTQQQLLKKLKKPKIKKKNSNSDKVQNLFPNLIKCNKEKDENVVKQALHIEPVKAGVTIKICNKDNDQPKEILIEDIQLLNQCHVNTGSDDLLRDNLNSEMNYDVPDKIILHETTQEFPDNLSQSTETADIKKQWKVETLQLNQNKLLEKVHNIKTSINSEWKIENVQGNTLRHLLLAETPGNANKFVSVDATSNGKTPYLNIDNANVALLKHPPEHKAHDDSRNTVSVNKKLTEFSKKHRSDQVVFLNQRLQSVSDNFKREVRLKNGELRRLKLRIKKFKETLGKQKKMIKYYEQLDKLHYISQNFIKCQLDNVDKKPCGRKFSEEDKIFAQSIFNRSRTVYKFLSNFFILPCKSTMKLFNKVDNKLSASLPFPDAHIMEFDEHYASING